MKVKHLCFDLDGTLVDSSETIYKSTIATLEQLGISYNFRKDDLDKRIGQHFVDIFNEFNVQVTDFEEFIKLYKSLYFDFIEDSILYPGVFETIEHLKKNDFKISLLTTKAQDQADLIIDHFSLRPYFDFVMGRVNSIPHKPAPEPLLMICEKLKVLPGETIMIGDTELDIQCGKNAGTRTCGVSYGYRTIRQLEDNDPDFIIDSIIELKEMISNGKLF
ncbi:MAG TPA: HAD-IA family hydrolase [Ignavibacteriaceae bacterium]|nr:HAD-IA family hydrolase [Ignavibacteriaceae bacterium]